MRLLVLLANAGQPCLGAVLQGIILLAPLHTCKSHHLCIRSNQRRPEPTSWRRGQELGLIMDGWRLDWAYGIAQGGSGQRCLKGIEMECFALGVG